MRYGMTAFAARCLRKCEESNAAMTARAIVFAHGELGVGEPEKDGSRLASDGWDRYRNVLLLERFCKI